MTDRLARRLLRLLVDELGRDVVAELLEDVATPTPRRRATLSPVETARRAADLVTPDELAAARARRMRR